MHTVTYADAPALTVMATLGGHASIRLDDSEAAPVCLAAGDIALVTRTNQYTIADDPSTAHQVTIRGGRKYLPGGEQATGHWNLAPRTYGDGLPGATIMLRAAYELHGDVSDRLLTPCQHWLWCQPDRGPERRWIYSPPRPPTTNPARTLCSPGC